MPGFAAVKANHIPGAGQSRRYTIHPSSRALSFAASLPCGRRHGCWRIAERN